MILGWVLLIDVTRMTLLWKELITSEQGVLTIYTKIYSNYWAVTQKIRRKL